MKKRIQGDKNTINYESSYKNIWKNKGSRDAGYKLETECTREDYHLITFQLKNL